MLSHSHKENNNKTDTKKNADEIDENIEQIFHIVSESFQLIHKDNLKMKKKKEILVEWREVARRLGM